MLRIAFIAAVVGGVACSSFTSAPAGDPDAAASDGGTDSDPGLPDAGPSDAGPPNLLVNGDFENGCTGWVAHLLGDLQQSSLARTGTGACRFCMKPGRRSIFLKGTESAVLAAGSAYQGEIALRVDEGSRAPERVEMVLDTSPDVGEEQLEVGSASAVTPTNAYQVLSSTIAVKDPADGGGTRVRVFVEIFSDPDAASPFPCLIFDDARIVRTK